MKVRGFQVAPAELEGCILDHRDVSDACVVGIPDDYSMRDCFRFVYAANASHLGGEVPLAFVVLTSDAEAKVKGKPQEAMKVKESIIKVRCQSVSFSVLKMAAARGRE